MSQPSIFARALSAVGIGRTDAAPALPGPEQPRTDGLANLLSGLGQRGHDKSLASTVAPFLPLNRVELEDLYEGDDAAQRIIDAVPSDCVRRGWAVQVDVGDDVADPFADLWSSVDLAGAMHEAHTWARLYGGGAVVLGLDDGATDMAEPVNPSTLRGLTFALAVDRWELTPEEWQMDPRQPGFGLPSGYRFSPVTARALPGAMQRIHASRILRFDGRKLPRTRRSRTDYWGGAVLDAVWPVLQAYTSAMQGMAHLVHEYEIKTLSVSGLRNMAMTADGREKVTERVLLFKQGLGLAKLGVIDADGESLSRMSASVSGLADLYDRFALALAGAADMPMSRMFGQGPSGFSADDLAGARWYYDRVAAVQRTSYAPHLLRLARLYIDAGLVDVPTDAEVKVTFAPLHEPTEKEKAETRHTDAQADQIHWQLGALDETEIRASAYSGAGYSSDRRLLTAQEREAAAADGPDNGEGGDGGNA